MARQILGHSTTAAYTHVLSHGARCVEIDVPSAKGPIVTHGHTFSKNALFFGVCKAIGDRVTTSDRPILVSLEYHIGVDGQPKMINLMNRSRVTNLSGKPCTERLRRGISTTAERKDPVHGMLVVNVASFAESSGLDEVLPRPGTMRRTRGDIHRRLAQ